MKNEKSDDDNVKKTENGKAKNSNELLTELEECIVIPEEWDKYEGIFSFRKLWLFTGPGWLSTFLIIIIIIFQQKVKMFSDQMQNVKRIIFLNFQ